MRARLFPLVLLLLLLCAACAGQSARTAELLEKNHQTMSDQEILAYYYQLNDQIAREERPSGGTAVGVGVGRGPFGVGLSQRVGRPRIADDLRDRRNEVRAELTRRGLRP